MVRCWLGVTQLAFAYLYTCLDDKVVLCHVFSACVGHSYTMCFSGVFRVIFPSNISCLMHDCSLALTSSAHELRILHSSQRVFFFSFRHFITNKFLDFYYTSRFHKTDNTHSHTVWHKAIKFAWWSNLVRGNFLHIPPRPRPYCRSGASEGLNT